MLLTGGRVAESAEKAGRHDLWLHNGTVSFSAPPTSHHRTLGLQGYLVLPGLINAHDHLELNLFPRLGNRRYANATDWANDIYHPEEPPVKQHASIPKHLRLWWGALKNLVSGVTTVAHHNDLHPALLAETFPIRVVKSYGWAHSLQFAPDWETRFRETPPNSPFMIHAAEGTDRAARAEIHTLDRKQALGPLTVLIHCVAAGPEELALIARRGSSVVWCPSSNHFTLGASLSSEVLESGVPIALATDSALTAAGDLLDELHFAHQTVSANRLYAMVTSKAAEILHLPPGAGKILHGGAADLLVMRDDRKTPADTLLSNLPELVIVGGQVVLASARFAQQMPVALRPLYPFTVAGRGSFLSSFSTKRLTFETNVFLPEGIQLAGKAVAA
jgi:cytosine/adenosine deaminase-related metal-dependent hydrolase